MEEPAESPMKSFYFTSFWNLNTERRFEHGPIPWACILEYGCYIGLDDDILDSFVALMRAMDAAYITWVAEDIERKRQHKTKK